MIINLANFAALVALSVAGGPLKEVEKPPSPANAQIRADLGGDGRLTTIRLDTTRRNPTTLTNGGRTVLIDIRRRWKPWSITTADLSGNGRREIVVALYKSTRHMPEPHNCLFVYRYDGREVTPVWLGSTLGRPFTAFAFGRAAMGRDERLVTLDIWMDGRRGISIHRWTGFGFYKELSWGRWRRARLLSVRDGRVRVIADGRHLDRSLEGER